MVKGKWKCWLSCAIGLTFSFMSCLILYNIITPFLVYVYLVLFDSHNMMKIINTYSESAILRPFKSYVPRDWKWLCNFILRKTPGGTTSLWARMRQLIKIPPHWFPRVSCLFSLFRRWTKNEIEWQGFTSLCVLLNF